ncbi:MAG: glycosyltransferase family 2 protein [Bacteroidales bacterium]|nr:glycosyltransferase family 2 protein [Bacteroidales bacterium]
MIKINCFVPAASKKQADKTLEGLKESSLVHKVIVLDVAKEPIAKTTTIRKIAAKSDCDYTLIYTKQTTLSIGYLALERMVDVAKATGAVMVYADHYAFMNGERTNKPVIDYQKGSLRNDFDFGSVLLYKTSALKAAVKKMKTVYKYAALYDLRLKVSQLGELVHINEYLYSEIEEDTRKTGEKLFDYVDPRNRDVQIEMEAACTCHLKDIGGYLEPKFPKISFGRHKFEYEASVIIPVLNRVKTIKDAIMSALTQQCSFKFNVIVVENGPRCHSWDGTTEVIKSIKDKRLVHIIPTRKDIGVGGAWNMALNHPKCGKFAVQLDSDDIYSGEDTLQKIVDAFYAQNCAMVIGSYMLTDINLKMLPPGKVDHREWTPENGRNNALRINGLGAPRAFYTPVVREIGFPNVNYGEDYAVGLAISRKYQIGRIYDVLYYCRRHDENSDAALSVEKENLNNTYKDRIRTWELQARISLNGKHRIEKRIAKVGKGKK